MNPITKLGGQTKAKQRHRRRRHNIPQFVLWARYRLCLLRQISQGLDQVELLRHEPAPPYCVSVGGQALCISKHVQMVPVDEHWMPIQELIELSCLIVLAFSAAYVPERSLYWIRIKSVWKEIETATQLGDLSDVMYTDNVYTELAYACGCDCWR